MTIVLKGRPASPGMVRDIIHPVVRTSVVRIATGDPIAETEALLAAMRQSSMALGELMRGSDDEAADMIGFQLALLEDEELTRPAFEAIATGVAADVAFADAMDAEIAGYKSGDDDYFRARASDLRDLRDQVLTALSGGAATEAPPPGAILLGLDMPPSTFLSVDWSQGGGIMLCGGSPASHVAMLARSRGVPMVVDLGHKALTASGLALLDGGSGEIVLDPDQAASESFSATQQNEARLAMAARELLDKPAVTRDGTRILVYINVADPAELKTVDPSHCDGIGLVRTEFLFHGRAQLPGEEAQFGVYRTIAEWAGGKPVTIRTLDAGGDKPIPGLTPDGESNPFLGMRGIRLSLAHQDVLRVQLRALLRAAAYGTIKIMLPMVTNPAELDRTATLLNEEYASLKDAGRKAEKPPLGIMVEVPAAAIAVDLFDAAFFSIGSNDLTQYVTAAGRDIGAVADLADPCHPAVLRLVGHVAEHGKATGRDVSLCGDAGGDPRLPHLLAAGLRSVSVSPAALARTKATIAALSLPTGKQASDQYGQVAARGEAGRKREAFGSTRGERRRRIQGFAPEGSRQSSIRDTAAPRFGLGQKSLLRDPDHQPSLSGPYPPSAPRNGVRDLPFFTRRKESLPGSLRGRPSRTPRRSAQEGSDAQIRSVGSRSWVHPEEQGH